MYKNYVLKSNSCVQSIYKNKIYSKIHTKQTGKQATKWKIQTLTKSVIISRSLSKKAVSKTFKVEYNKHII